MTRRILIFAAIAICYVNVYGHNGTRFGFRHAPAYALDADSIVLFDTLGNKINNGILHIVGTNPDADALTAYIRIKNNTVSPLSLYVKRIVNQQVDESANWFCFGITCYGPMTDSSNSVTLIEPGQVNKSFYGDYSPSGKGGLTSITYEFYDKQTYGTRLTARATVEYSVSATAVSQRDFRMSIGPNPVSGKAILQYNLPSDKGEVKVIVRGTNAGVVKELNLIGRSGSRSVDFSDCSPGIYFCTILSDGKPYATRKILVVK